MKNTKKNLVKVADLKFTIFAINENGSRGLQYGGLRGVRFVEVMMMYASQGKKMIIVQCDDAYDITKEVYGSIQNNSQIDPEFYNKMLPYSVTLGQFIKD